MSRVSAALMLALLLAACAAPRPVVKIALVAPFEGRASAIGNAAFPEFRSMLRARAEAGGVGGYDVQFVAYTDDGEPEKAARIARAVVLDPEVMVVIGHFTPAASAAAAQIYQHAGLAQIDVCGAPGQTRCIPSLAEAETRALDALAAALAGQGAPSRAAVLARIALASGPR